MFSVRRGKKKEREHFTAGKAIGVERAKESICEKEQERKREKERTGKKEKEEKSHDRDDS